MDELIPQIGDWVFIDDATKECGFVIDTSVDLLSDITYSKVKTEKYPHGAVYNNNFLKVKIRGQGSL